MADVNVLPDEIWTTSTSRLRAATVDDAPILVILYRQLHSSDELDMEGFVSELDRIQATANRWIYLYEADGDVVGTIDVFLMRNLTRSQRPWAGVENFVVDERHRRQGHGRSILESTIETVRRLGAYKVQLISADRRRGAHSLYTAVGFTAPVTGFRAYVAQVGH